ncbi:MAG: peptidoglycan-binding protein [Raineya sp.]|jgi:hypothetical protein|nr:peptidoglycan-binding protein [Raineya sp.]
MENQETTNKGKKIIFWVIIGIILLVLVLFFCKMWKEKKKKEKREQNIANANIQEVKTDGVQSEPIPKTLPSYQEKTDGFPLSKGSVGKSVEQLQIYLLKNWGFQGKIDGKFGDETKAAVKKILGVEEVSESIFNRYDLSTVKTVIYK